MKSCLDKNNKKIASHYQNIMILKEVHILFLWDVFRGKKTISSHELFIVRKNIDKDFKIDEA